MVMIGGVYGSHIYVEIVLQCYGFEAPVRDSVMWEVMRILSTTQDNDIPKRTHNTLAYTIILTHVHTSLNGLLPTRESTHEYIHEWKLTKHTLRYTHIHTYVTETRH